jgi:hypothetical protein
LPQGETLTVPADAAHASIWVLGEKTYVVRSMNFLHGVLQRLDQDERPMPRRSRELSTACCASPPIARLADAPAVRHECALPAAAFVRCAAASRVMLGS